MAFASESFTGVAAQQVYVFGTGTGSSTSGLKFLTSDHISVKVNGVSTTFTVASTQLSFTITGVSIVGGETILVTRATPVTEAGRLVNFEDLSHLRQSDLDISAKQLLFIAQESLDGMASATCLSLGGGGQWDALTKRIQNLAAGTAASHAITKAQLDAATIAAGDLPAVTGADNDKSLWVVSGAWAIRTPTQARVHLGLGTAATLNVGTGANQVVQLDGSARYPAVDGRNIDLSAHSLTTAVLARYLNTLGRTLQSTEFDPFDSTGAWQENNSSRIDLGTLDAANNGAPDITLNAGMKFLTLTAGTWEISFTIRVHNVNGTANVFRRFAFRITDDVDGPTQVTYYNHLDGVDIEADTPADPPVLIADNLLLKLATSKNLVFRAAQTDGLSSDIRVSYFAAVVRKVSASFT